MSGSGRRAGGVGGSREGRGALAGDYARAQSVERRDSAVLSAHEAVRDIDRVRHLSRNNPRRVDV